MNPAAILTLPPGAPAGGIEGCAGDLVLDIQRNDCGSWSTACSVDLTIYCEARGCWWSRLVTGPITAETFAEANRQHGADTLWPRDAPKVDASSSTDRSPSTAPPGDTEPTPKGSYQSRTETADDVPN